jgi:hypothetical protein
LESPIISAQNPSKLIFAFLLRDLEFLKKEQKVIMNQEKRMRILIYRFSYIESFLINQIGCKCKVLNTKGHACHSFLSSASPMSFTRSIVNIKNHILLFCKKKKKLLTTKESTFIGIKELSYGCAGLP